MVAGIRRINRSSATNTLTIHSRIQSFGGVGCGQRGGEGREKDMCGMDFNPLPTSDCHPLHKPIRIYNNGEFIIRSILLLVLWAHMVQSVNLSRERERCVCQARETDWYSSKPANHLQRCMTAELIMQGLRR